MTTHLESHKPPKIPATAVLSLLENISTWGNVTTIVFQQGCVFEFKGNFPKGGIAHGYYNLENAQGFQGHIKLEAIDHVAFQTTPHRGKASFALVFNTLNNDCIFKVFLGRDEHGEVLVSQLNHFNQLLD